MNDHPYSLSSSSTAAATVAVAIVAGVVAYKAFHHIVRSGGNETSTGCCPRDSLPAKPERYVPRGKCFELPPSNNQQCGNRNPLRVYVVAGGEEPSNKNDDSWPRGKPCIIMSPDMAGMDSGLHKKLADDFARRLDAVVVLYDPFDGKPFMAIPDSDDGQPQQAGLNLFTVKFLTALICRVPSVVKANDWETVVKPLFTDQLLPFLESKLGSTRFSLVGFCYGGWVVLKASQDKDLAPHIQCGISFHPSVQGVEQKAFGKDDIELCRNCRVPQMVHATKSEPDAWKPEGEAHRALQANPNVKEVRFTLAPSTESHGFMTRSDLSNQDSARAIQEGTDLAVEFMRKHNNT